ncbi:MAG: NUMOD3 domain-containing DNA-binding protein [Acetobacter sp.]|uniref:NUMOD3 domain-containing DNA-binding protein n=1 Tax=Acetobacter sp. TaxID=440 RepID=UPI003CFEE318
MKQEESHDCYLYKITNFLNDKSYIGITNNPDRRLREHCGAKTPDNSSAISSAILKYGKENFSFEVILNSTRNECSKYEYDLTLALDTIAPNGYNLKEGGLNNFTVSDETRLKLSKAHKGRSPPNKGKPGKKWSEETRAKTMAARGEVWNKGKKLTDEEKAKLPPRKKGYNLPDSTRKKMSVAKKGRPALNKGVKAKPETIEKCRKASTGNQYALGYKHTEETKALLSLKGKGKKRSEETKARMSEAARKRWADRKSQGHTSL